LMLFQTANMIGKAPLIDPKDRIAEILNVAKKEEHKDGENN